MAKSGYSVGTTADVALVAATAKTILGVLAPSSFGLDLTGISIGFDGTTAGNEPVLVELMRCTFATNPPGTNSTSRTPAQTYGLRIAHGTTAASAWTTEPTALTLLEEFPIHPQAGAIYQFPLGQSFDCVESTGFVIRCTAPDAVNVRATLKWERT